MSRPRFGGRLFRKYVVVLLLLVGGVLMACNIVRTTVPLADRGFSQSRNAVKMDGLIELSPVHLLSQMPWNVRITQPPPWASALVT